jgi:prephenate dehydrogenase
MSDLLVIGAGHLGARVAVMWRVKFPDSKIFLKTKSENAERSEKWRALGYEPVSSATPLDTIRKFPYVVYSVPPIAGNFVVHNQGWNGHASVLCNLNIL